MAQDLPAQLKTHVSYLASDKLGGRLTGSKHEVEASIYIKKQFADIGLKPGGDVGTFYQTFTFHTGYRHGKKNSLKIGKEKLALNQDFYPLAYSANGKISGEVINTGFGIQSKENNYDDFKDSASLKGKILLINLSLPDGDHPHSKFLEFKAWKKRLEAAKKLKPKAIVFYNSKDDLGVEEFKKYHNLQQENIPLIHVSSAVAEKIKSAKKISLTVDLQKDVVTGRNVVGLINNQKPNTIIIGAHYDHLGLGEYGNSLYTGKEKHIHNGADDNASGTAALIELARMISKGNTSDYNYMFVAFSGEELGLLGSNYFVKNMNLPHAQVNCMINMDMVGRLDSTTHELGIYGVGTSPEWEKLMKQVSNYSYFKVKTTESGIGSSDHSSFYMKDIPVLHFFTGTHQDYHKPDDDIEKLNYGGEAEVVNYIYGLVKILNGNDKLAFTKTKDETASTPRFKVTLGIVPDYFYEGPGIKVDGISPSKPAEKAGLKSGDVVVKINDYEVKDMHNYMEILGKFEKGQDVKVHIKRGEKMLELPLKF
ncbi:MAG: M20/M25/M40 family metallo-hydrolase [Bacteroidia bacterium]